MNSKTSILLVDDDPQLCELLCDYLQQYQYTVTVAHHGSAMMKLLQQHDFDLVILDVMLPGEDGFALCKKLREQSAISIIMLSAAGDEADRVLGLEMGADDYLTKPFSSRELLARVKSLLRRSHGALAEQRRSIHQSKLPAIQFLDWTLDLMKHSLIDGEGVTVPLSHGEYELLLAFVERPQRVLSRELLLDITSDRDATPFDRSIDVQVGRLRKKLETDPKDPQIIITVRGGGYQFVPEVRQES